MAEGVSVESENLFSFLEAFVEPVVVLGAAGEVAGCNAAARRLLLIDGEELPGCVTELFPGFQASRLSGGYSVEAMARRGDGSTFPAELTLSEVRNGRGHLFLCALRDVTERRRRLGIESLLHDIDSLVLQGRELDAMLAHVCRRVVELFDYPLIWIGLKERDGSVSVRAHHGAGADYLNRLRVRWDREGGALCPAGLAISSGRVQTIGSGDSDFSRWRRFADDFGFESFVSLPLRVQGEVLGVLNICSRQTGDFEERSLFQLQELADRLTVAIQLVMDQRRLRLQGIALSSAANAVIITDRKGHIEWVNDAFERLSGYSFAEAQGNTPRILNSGAQEQAVFDALWRTIGSGHAWRGELINRHKNGGLYVVEQTITPMRDEEGHVTHFVAIHEDVTERKQVERELQEARDAALEASRIKSDFLANISHEIRTPMNGVLGMLSLLRETNLSLTQRDYAETALRSGDILLNLLNNILDYSKIEAGRLELEHIEFSPYQALEEITELHAARAYDKGIELASLMDPGVPKRLLGDPTRLRQILANLVGNAVKFTGQGEVVSRASLVSRHGNWVTLRFEVRDSGIGIAPEFQPRIFDIFSQADGSTTRKYGGSGLGLAICRELVERMGGAIGVRSMPGEGSTFWFTARFNVAPEEEEGSGEFEGVKILVVEPGETWRTVLARYVAAFGARVESVEDLEAARFIQTQRPCDVVILGEALMGEEAERFATALKASGCHLLLAVPFNYRERGDRLETLSDGLLRKPLRLARVHDAIAGVLGMAAQETEEEPLPPPGTLRDMGGARILVVEDNLVNQKVTLGMLRRLGYVAEVVESGREAVEAQAREPFALIFMDLQMPELDGFEATRLIRQMEGERCHTPIVALTASTSRGDQQCLEAGMDDYLLKPVRIEALQRAVRRWLPQLESASFDKVDEPAASDSGGRSDAVLDQTIVAQLREIMGAAFAEVVEAFTGDAPGRIEELEQLHAAGDLERLLRVTHALKGSSANVGALPLSLLCQELEDQCRSGSHAGLPAAVAAIRAEYPRVEAALAGLLDQPG